MKCGHIHHVWIEVNMENIENNDLRFNSYLTKDELINLLNNIHFERVKHLHMDLITGYLITNDPNNLREQDIKPLYYTIDIE